MHSTSATSSPEVRFPEASAENGVGAGAAQRALLWLAVGSAGVGSATLFALEPFVSKVLLPHLGGTAAVWTTCMLVYQLLLLFGYGYSVLLGRTRSIARAARVHALLIILTALITPFSLRLLWLEPSPHWPPVLWIGAVVIGAIGLPFCLLSATSPLLQLWLTRQSHAVANVHRLYAVTNLANFVGLGLYVGVLEPLLGVRMQSWVLLGATLIALLSSLLVAAGCARTQTVFAVAPDAPVTAISGRARARWVLWSFAASFALFAVSTYLATDVAAFPLLFVIPLGLFLLGFALGYSAWAERHLQLVQRLGFLVPLLALTLQVRRGNLEALSFAFFAPLLALLCLSCALAATLARERPASDRLPEYYAAIGVGGVLAGVVSVVILPWGYAQLFEDPSFGAASAAAVNSLRPALLSIPVPECPLALLLGIALLADTLFRRLVVGLMLLIAALGGSVLSLPVDSLYLTRNFYGMLRIAYERSSKTVTLVNGTTVHGSQKRDDANPQPNSYYHAASPIGQVMAQQLPKRVLVVGLGTGSMAAWAKPGDVYDFLEINPSVAALAEQSPWFKYIAAARERGAQIRVHVGDGRMLTAALAPDVRYDLVVLDAFASDSIPVHLLTREAFQTFAAHTAGDGAIAVHVSNNFFDLVPGVAALSRELGWHWASQYRLRAAENESLSRWVVLTPSSQTRAKLGLEAAPWDRSFTGPEPRAWTDDWANPLGALRPVSTWRWDHL